jgi:DNA-binding transcriptional MocR family regulator
VELDWNAHANHAVKWEHDIADGIRLLCLDNRLAVRTLLPAERELAAVLGLSRTTVATAYRSLRDSSPPQDPATPRDSPAADRSRPPTR